MQMLQPTDTTCPLGLICAQMTTEVSCPNYSTCLSTREAIDPIDSEDDSPEDALSDRDFYLTRTYYRKAEHDCRWGDEIDQRSGWFWTIHVHADLPEGYAIAVDAQIAAHYDPGVLTVTQDRAIESGVYQRAEWNKAFWFEVDGSPIVLIEWIRTQAGKRSIRLIHTEDSDGRWWCDEDKNGHLLCSRDASECPEAEYWFRYDQPEPETYGDEAKRVTFPVGEELAQLKAQIQSIYTCEESFYCTVCNAATYESDYGWSECKHLRYIDHLASWGGVGYGAEDYSETYAESFALLSRQPEANAVREALTAKNWQRLWDMDFTSDSEELKPAIAYLHTLDDNTPTAFDQCLEWMDQPEN
jgi:hypothetical protein